MGRWLTVASLVVCLLAVTAPLQGSAAVTSQTTAVSGDARLTLGMRAGGSDSALTFAPGAHLRITAAGSVATLSAACAGMVAGPRGCSPAAEPGSAQPLAPGGSLIATFVDARGRQIAPSFFVGEAALVIAPPVPSRLVFAINAAPSTQASGTFRVTTALADATSTSGGISARQFVQHLLRRFAFSAAPATIDALTAQGSSAWLASQLAPGSIDDSAAQNALEPKPNSVDAKGHIVNEYGFERRLVQRQAATTRQVQEKMVLHWLDHFAVGDAKVRDQAMMSHYEETLRADALGNFKTLVSDVAKEPAILYWLDNNWNNGADPVHNPPNENFSRELMQLYMIGTSKLNMDGSVQKDAAGNPIPNYSQSDVQVVAQALSGFGVSVNYAAGTDPNTRFSVAFYPKRHTPGAKSIMGAVVSDPGNASCVDATIASIASNPSVAPFQAQELLQRFVTESPSPQYVSAIAQVWNQTADAPDQIAQVVKAIVNNPEFATSYHSMTKEPLELTIGMLRQLPGVLRTAWYNGQQIGPGNDLVGQFGYLGSALQEPYFSPSVFSFYRPGAKNALLSQATTLNRFDFASDALSASPSDPSTNTAIDTAALQSRIGSSDPGKVSDYLLDAMVDGGTPSLRASLMTYLGNGVDDTHLRGAIWLIATAPEYQVN